MSSICGWASIDGQSLDIHAMASTLSASSEHSITTTSSENCCTAFAISHKSVLFTENTEFFVAIGGHPRWKNDPSVTSILIAERFLQTFHHVGIRALDELQGQFVIALARKNGREALLAIDRIGSNPLKYMHTNGTLVFGSTADAVNNGLKTCMGLDPQAIFNYVYFEMVPAPNTAFDHIHGLLPGQYIHFTDGCLNKGLYWRADYRHIERKNHKLLVSELFEKLEDSVRDTATSDMTGTFLSGGIDSSTVTGILSRISNNPVRTYSIGFDAPGYDEMDYARIAAKHFGTDHHEYYVTPDDVAKLAPLAAEAYDAPFGNASVIPTYYCANLARQDGINLLLGGDGGDELFGGNARYAKQWLLSLYDHIPFLLRNGIIEPSLSPAFFDSIPAVRKARSYIRQASAPMPERLESYNLVNQIGPQHIFTQDFLASINPGHPLEILSEEYHGALADNIINNMLAVDMRFTLADNDLKKVSGMCAMAGVDIAFPLLDNRLIDFSLRLPATMKVHRTHLRYFFKRAMANFLPQEILEKKKHGFGLPFGVWLQSNHNLRSLAIDNLTALKARGIISPAFLDELISVRLSEHAAYYGTMVWILMMLELWLNSRKL